MNAKQIRKIALVLAVWLIATGLFYFLVRDDWHETAISNNNSSREFCTEELTSSVYIVQKLNSDIDLLQSIAIDVNIWGDEAEKCIYAYIIPEDLLNDDVAKMRSGAAWSASIPYCEITHDNSSTLELYPNFESNRNSYYLILNADGNIALWYNSGIVKTRFGSVDNSGDYFITMYQTDNTALNSDQVTQTQGKLSIKTYGLQHLYAEKYIFPVSIAILLLGLTYILWTKKKEQSGQLSALSKIIGTTRRYYYLLKQLVSRDFRVKYQASMLGVLWSFLNPLIMTFVYYFVFSTLFKNDIDYFVIYLMCGIIAFNYFSEASSLGLVSIVSNASLITKIYVPKYIFPISKALSSSINMLISYIPLFIMMAFSGLPFRKSLFLLPIALIFLIMFTIGIEMLLSSMYVFFRDTQFLWSIMITIWNFLTPIFYPDSIIPQAYQQLYHLNPLYQICYFIRTVVIGGISPTPVTYLYCLIECAGTLVIGLAVFKRQQNKFATYL